MFRDMSLDPRVRHAVAAIVKVTVMDAALKAGMVLADRCGAQGLFQVNQISAIHVSGVCYRLSSVKMYAYCILI